MLPQIFGEFRVVADPELKFTQGGMAVANMRIVADSKKKVGEEWVDDKVCWLRATAFKKQAENVAESFVKGSLVVITGRLQTEEWEKDGEKRQAYTVLIDNIGPSARWNPTKSVAADRGSGSSGSSSSGGDPWATPQTNGVDDEPPF